MKNFKGNALMQEMNLNEMQELNGGNVFLHLLLTTIAVEIAMNPVSAYDSFMAGYHSVL